MSQFSKQLKETRSDFSLDTITMMVEERRLLRILQPSLQQKIEKSIRYDPHRQEMIVYHNNELYLSLQNIDDSRHREQAYQLIQQYQIDNSVDLSKLPIALRTCLQPRHVRRTRLMGAVVIGAVVGIAFGLMSMALGVLLLSIIGLTDELFGIGVTVTAVIFVIACAAGWITATVYLWRKTVTFRIFS
ncbi:MAG: hypothetical protein GY796_27870 [Chloroflexi bacterium]|nr:hypothetical protein [Chloroflexota bacterium]